MALDFDGFGVLRLIVKSWKRNENKYSCQLILSLLSPSYLYGLSRTLHPTCMPVKSWYNITNTISKLLTLRKFTQRHVVIILKKYEGEQLRARHVVNWKRNQWYFNSRQSIKMERSLQGRDTRSSDNLPIAYCGMDFVKTKGHNTLYNDTFILHNNAMLCSYVCISTPYYVPLER